MLEYLHLSEPPDLDIFRKLVNVTSSTQEEQFNINLSTRLQPSALITALNNKTTPLDLLQALLSEFKANPNILSKEGFGVFSIMYATICAPEVFYPRLRLMLDTVDLTEIGVKNNLQSV